MAEAKGPCLLGELGGHETKKTLKVSASNGGIGCI